jgi:hypothetical protein
MWPLCGKVWKEGTEVTSKAEQVAVERYDAHYEGVKELAKDKERLLECNPAEGWRPLCAFLDVAVPFVKGFPRVNDADEFVVFHRKWYDGLKTKAEGLKGVKGKADVDVLIQ